MQQQDQNKKLLHVKVLKQFIMFHILLNQQYNYFIILPKINLFYHILLNLLMENEKLLIFLIKICLHQIHHLIYLI